MNELINPASLVKPVGYSHAVASTGGKTVYLGGQVSFDSNGNVAHVGDVVGQFRQTIANLKVCVEEAGGKLTDIVKLTIFVKDRDLYKEHLKEIGGVYREFFGKYFPAMTLVEVSNLFEDLVLMEIEGIAVIH